MLYSNVDLIFPPLTEARLFPYGSLPMLSAYIRSLGGKPRCFDFNLDLTKRLCDESVVHTYLEQLGYDLKSEVRRVFANYFLENRQEAMNAVWGSGPKYLELPSGLKAYRLLLNMGEAILEESVLKKSLWRLDQLQTSLPPEDLAGSVFLNGAMQTDFSNSQVVGFSIPYFSQLQPAIFLAKALKKSCPEILVVLGGPQIYLHGETLAKSPQVCDCVDFLCLDRCEAPLRDLMEGDENPEGMIRPGGEKTYVASQPIPLNDLPVPDYDDIPVEDYLSEEIQIGIISCYGCYWGRCTFCSYGQRSYREKSYDQYSPESLAWVCETLHHRYGIKRINFVDENTNLRFLHKALKILKNRNVKIRFSTRNRLEPILRSQSFVGELVDMGLVLMSVGYDTNSQRLLDKVEKGVIASSYQDIIDNLYESGVPLRLSVLSGIPGETEAERKTSYEFLKKNEAKIGIDVTQALIPEPKTPLGESETFQLSTELHSNQRLNYGGGRYGHKIPDFEDAEESLVRVNNGVLPGQNDERSRRRIMPAGSQPIKDRYPLTPWTIAVKDRARGRKILYNVARQSFVPVPEEKVSDERMILISNRSEFQRLKRENFIEDDRVGNKEVVWQVME